MNDYNSNININQMKSLIGNDLFEFELENNVLEILKNSTAFLVGILSLTLIIKTFELIIPNTKYKEIIMIISIFSMIILVLFLAGLLLTIHQINIKRNNTLKYSN